MRLYTDSNNMRKLKTKTGYIGDVECKEMCENNPYCTHAILQTAAGGNNTCWSKGLTPQNEMVVGIKRDDGTYRIYENADIKDITTIGSGTEIGSMKECQDKCSADPNCMIYNSGMSSGKLQCWLKKYDSAGGNVIMYQKN